VAHQPIDLVIFDCDGVLVDSEPLANRLLAEALTAEGFPTTPEECLERYTGISMRAAFAMVEAEWGRRLPADFEERVKAHDLEVFARELKPVAGVREALARIPLPKCVASSGAPDKIRLSLTLTGLIGFFAPHLFSAHQVARGKPAPDLFHFASETMKVPPWRCCVVEDSEAGIQAARAAGMRVLGFAGAGHAGPGYADRLRRAGAPVVFDDMADLPNLLAAQAGERG